MLILALCFLTKSMSQFQNGASSFYSQYTFPVYTSLSNSAPVSSLPSPTYIPSVKTVGYSVNFPSLSMVAPPAVSAAPKLESKDAKKEAEEAEKKRQAQYEAQQVIVDARITTNARDLDVFAASNLINGILTNPLVADTAIGVSGFGGANGRLIRAGGQLARVRSRRQIASAYQRQIDRYIFAHPEPTKTDFDTVSQARAKRDEANYVGDSAMTNIFSAFVPSSNRPLASGLAAVSLTQIDQSVQSSNTAARHAFELAKDKFQKNTSDVSARQTFNQARDFREAKGFEKQGTSADRLNAVLPLVGASRNPLVAQYAALNLQKGAIGEKNIARRQLNIAEQKMEESPSEDNWLKLKLARATFDWRDSVEQFQRSRGFGNIASAALPSLWRNIFSASSTLRFKDSVEAQKRISRITLQIRKRDYAKKYGGADETESRMLALSTYGKTGGQSSSRSDSDNSAADPQNPAVLRAGP